MRRKDFEPTMTVDNLLEFAELLKSFTEGNFMITHSGGWSKEEPLKISKNALRHVLVNNNYVDFYVDALLLMRVRKNDCYYISKTKGLFVSVFDKSLYCAIEFHLEPIESSVEDSFLFDFTCHQVDKNNLNEPRCIQVIDTKNTASINAFLACLNSEHIYFGLCPSGNKTEIWVSGLQLTCIQY